MVTYYLALVDKFPKSTDLKKAERMYEDSRKELETIANQEKEKLNQQQKPAKVTATTAN